MPKYYCDWNKSMILIFSTETADKADLLLKKSRHIPILRISWTFDINRTWLITPKCNISIVILNILNIIKIQFPILILRKCKFVLIVDQLILSNIILPIKHIILSKTWIFPYSWLLYNCVKISWTLFQSFTC